jgi:hypothetical protein
MSNRNRCADAAMLILVGLLFSACASGEAAPKPAGERDARVERIAETDTNRVVLNEEAAERIGVKTDVVTDMNVSGVSRKAIPYAAVLYASDGSTFAYANPEPLVFVRVPLAVDHVDADRAVLADGPSPGTAVVTVGAVELLGTEFNVGE